MRCTNSSAAHGSSANITDPAAPAETIRNVMAETLGTAFDDQVNSRWTRLGG